jgi:hypothetical protein
MAGASSASSCSRPLRGLLVGAFRLDPAATVALGCAGALAAGVLVLMTRAPQPCEICGGMGSWDCVICGSNGVVVDGRKRTKCVACVGRGKRLCRACDGSGYKKITNYVG